MGVSDALARLAPQPAQACPHQLGKWVLRTRRSTQHYPDGGLRTPEHRGGRYVLVQEPCARPAGHGWHRTGGGRQWS